MELNATYLFEKPNRKFHNAEPWWTAYFSLLALWLAGRKKPVILPTYRIDTNWKHNKIGSASFSEATYRTLIADARLCGEPFGISDWPNKFLHLRPDITYFASQENRHVAFVETKTIGASILGNVELYARLSDYLRARGWSVDMYYLLSVGHEEQRDWSLLAKASAQIITWEDVFSLAADTPFGEIFGEPVTNYIR